MPVPSVLREVCAKLIIQLQVGEKLYRVLVSVALCCHFVKVRKRHNGAVWEMRVQAAHTDEKIVSATAHHARILGGRLTKSSHDLAKAPFL